MSTAIKIDDLKDELLGLAEVANLLGWHRSQVNLYMRREKFPKPAFRLAATPVWTRGQIEEYVEKRRKEYLQRNSLKY